MQVCSLYIQLILIFDSHAPPFIITAIQDTKVTKCMYVKATHAFFLLVFLQCLQDVLLDFHGFCDAYLGYLGKLDLAEKVLV